MVVLLFDGMDIEWCPQTARPLLAVHDDLPERARFRRSDPSNISDYDRKRQLDIFGGPHAILARLLYHCIMKPVRGPCWNTPDATVRGDRILHMQTGAIISDETHSSH
jgi:hypothetical protein